MDIIQIVTLGIIACILYMILKDVNETFAFLLIIVTGIMIFLSIINQIGVIVDLINSLGQKADIDGMYLDTIIKIIGIAYLTEIGANITRDAGLDSVGMYIELAGKIFILILAVPIITAVIEAILGFLPMTS